MSVCVLYKVEDYRAEYVDGWSIQEEIVFQTTKRQHESHVNTKVLEMHMVTFMEADPTTTKQI